MPRMHMTVEDRDTAYALIEEPGVSIDGLEGLFGYITTIEPTGSLTIDDVKKGSIDTHDDGSAKELFWVQHFKPEEKITVHRTQEEVDAIPGIHTDMDSPCCIPSGIVCATREEYEARANGTYDEDAGDE